MRPHQALNHSYKSVAIKDRSHANAETYKENQR